MNDKIDYEKQYKRLVAMNNMGAWIRTDSGHRYLFAFASDIDYNLDRILRKGGILLNSKFYGGVGQVLDTVDEALKLIGESTLLERYDEAIFLPYFPDGVDRGRIDEVDKGQGGIF